MEDVLIVTIPNLLNDVVMGGDGDSSCAARPV